jgi:hypothetical protein
MPAKLFLQVISMLWVMLGHCMAVQASLGYVNPEVRAT